MPVTTADDYIREQPEIYRESLHQLRNIIRTTVPEAKETISYGMVCYSYKYMLVGFGASKNHFSFTAMSNTIFRKFEEELENMDTAIGTIRFKPGEILPVELITKIILEKKAENELRALLKNKK